MCRLSSCFRCSSLFLIPLVLDFERAFNVWNERRCSLDCFGFWQIWMQFHMSTCLAGERPNFASRTTERLQRVQWVWLLAKLSGCGLRLGCSGFIHLGHRHPKMRELRRRHLAACWSCSLSWTSFTHRACFGSLGYHRSLILESTWNFCSFFRQSHGQRRSLTRIGLIGSGSWSNNLAVKSSTEQACCITLLLACCELTLNECIELRFLLLSMSFPLLYSSQYSCKISLLLPRQLWTELALWHCLIC